MVAAGLSIVVGLALLIVAGDLLVRGAVAFALRLGIPALIVGLTIVAFGTSAPELMVSVAAVLDDAPDIALGNVIGSNIANILLVLGLPALIAVVRTDETDMRQSFAIMIATTVLFIVLAFLGPIGWPHALVLLLGLVAMIGGQVRDALAHRARNDAVEPEDPHLSWPAIAGFVATGLVGLPVGADLLVGGATHVARYFGVSEAVIGLTLVAVGTSLPELATSVTAALKGRADVALGNVIGSNIFNLLCIIGIAGLIAPLPVPPQMLRFDVWVMLATALMIAPFVLGKRPFVRWTGIVFVGLYAVYVLSLMWGHAG